MFFKYGEVLRQGPAAKTTEKNTYVTTIFCIVSGIIKLSKIMELPSDRYVGNVLVYIRVGDLLVYTINVQIYTCEFLWYS
jgi:hypothetical protein